jgi:hypothetical protein
MRIYLGVQVKWGTVVTLRHHKFHNASLTAPRGRARVPVDSSGRAREQDQEERLVKNLTLPALVGS